MASTQKLVLTLMAIIIMSGIVIQVDNNNFTDIDAIDNEIGRVSAIYDNSQETSKEDNYLSSTADNLFSDVSTGINPIGMVQGLFSLFWDGFSLPFKIGIDKGEYSTLFEYIIMWSLALFQYLMYLLLIYELVLVFVNKKNNG